MTIIEMVGEKFGRLTVREFAGIKGRKAIWLCDCDCGKSHSAVGSNIRNGQTQSCGCLQRETTGRLKLSHGKCKSPTYRSWASIKSRCYNPNQQCYEKYGAIGIRMCDRWLESFENFLEDMGERPEGMTLDRENPFGDYEPWNCRWATAETQSLNKRGHVAIAILEQLKKDGNGQLIAAAFEKMFPQPIEEK